VAVRSETLDGDQMLESDPPEVSYLLMIPTSEDASVGANFDLRLDS
jgi:hypothetical protein